MLQICENIKRARVSSGRTQTEMTKILELKNNSTYQNWEKSTVPDLETLKKIAQILGIPAWTLLIGVIDFFEGKGKAGTEGVPALVAAEVRQQMEVMSANLLELARRLPSPIGPGTNVVPGSVQKVNSGDKTKKKT